MLDIVTIKCLIIVLVVVVCFRNRSKFIIVKCLIIVLVTFYKPAFSGIYFPSGAYLKNI
jgi:hypothetical protein